MIRCNISNIKILNCNFGHDLATYYEVIQIIKLPRTALLFNVLITFLFISMQILCTIFHSKIKFGNQFYMYLSVEVINFLFAIAYSLHLNGDICRFNSGGKMQVAPVRAWFHVSVPTRGWVWNPSGMSPRCLSSSREYVDSSVGDGFEQWEILVTA